MKETQSNKPMSRSAVADEDDEENLRLAAHGQKIVIYGIVLNLILRAAERSQILAGIFADLVFICLTGYTLLGVAKICTSLGKSQNQKIGWMVLAFVPLIGLLVLVVLNVKASRMLRNAGWQVGLLGAKP
jgi:hypothetical protein